MAFEKSSKDLFNEDDEIIQNKEVESVSKWESLNLKAPLVMGIYKVGFENPSFIQKKAIPYISEGLDMRAQAQSGTGKTGAFVIGCLQRLDENLDATQVLVLASTREIALQNATKFVEIGHYMNVRVSLLAGGTSAKNDIDSLAKNPHIVVGTPGRINHMIEKGFFKTDNIKIFVLDEADEMLKAGFEEQVKEVYQRIEAKKFQTLLFSATYSEKDLLIIKDIVRQDAVEIDLRADEMTLIGIKQYYVDIGRPKYGGNQAKDEEVHLKVATLVDIFKNQTLAQVLIFINRKIHAALVYDLLNQMGYPCELMSSDLDQSARNRVLEEFKSGKIRILVSSGLLKRGIDVQSLSLVVCLDVPSEDEKNDYIHRVGRSGRYGRKGIALHILNSVEIELLKGIVKSFEGVIAPLPQGFNLNE